MCNQWVLYPFLQELYFQFDKSSIHGKLNLSWLFWICFIMNQLLVVFTFLFLKGMTFFIQYESVEWAPDSIVFLITTTMPHTICPNDFNLRLSHLIVLYVLQPLLKRICFAGNVGYEVEVSLLILMTWQYSHCNWYQELPAIIPRTMGRLCINTHTPYKIKTVKNWP